MKSCKNIWKNSCRNSWRRSFGGILLGRPRTVSEKRKTNPKELFADYFNNLQEKYLKYLKILEGNRGKISSDFLIIIIRIPGKTSEETAGESLKEGRISKENFRKCSYSILNAWLSEEITKGI